MKIKTYELPFREGLIFAKTWQPEGVVLDRAPIVLLHDSLGSVQQWRAFPEKLARMTARRVLAYDRWGFGQSLPRQAPVDASIIENEGRCAFLALSEFFALQKFVLFGHSVGGGMAVHIAAQNPQACVALITEAAQSFVEPQTCEGIIKTRQAFENPAIFAKLEKWHGERAAWVLAAWCDIWLNPSFVQNWHLDAVLQQVHAPSLVLHGSNDEYGSRALADRLLANLAAREKKLALFEGIGHIPHAEAPNLVLAEVRDFLANLP